MHVRTKDFKIKKKNKGIKSLKKKGGGYFCIRTVWSVVFKLNCNIPMDITLLLATDMITTKGPWELANLLGESVLTYDMKTYVFLYWLVEKTLVLRHRNILG